MCVSVYMCTGNTHTNVCVCVFNVVIPSSCTDSHPPFA